MTRQETRNEKHKIAKLHSQLNKRGDRLDGLTQMIIKKIDDIDFMEAIPKSKIRDVNEYLIEEGLIVEELSPLRIDMVKRAAIKMAKKYRRYKQQQQKQRMKGSA